MLTVVNRRRPPAPFLILRILVSSPFAPSGTASFLSLSFINKKGIATIA